MSVYPPPTANLAIFNKLVFEGAEFDGRYLKIEADTNLLMNGNDITGVGTLGFDDGTLQTTAFTGLLPGAIGLGNVLADDDNALGQDIINLGTLNFSNGTNQTTAYDNTITITNSNTNGVFFPVFVDADGLQKDLFADTTTIPFSINPNTGDFNVPTTLTLTQTQVGLGKNAGATSQGTNATALGLNAGTNTQGASSVAVGVLAGNSAQGASSVGVGAQAGRITQGANATAVGNLAGQNLQGNTTTAVGNQSGQTSQGTSATAVGNFAGNSAQGAEAVAVGNQAGRTSQGISAVAVGDFAGRTNQGANAIAIGNNAGAGDTTGQGANAIAIGVSAGASSQTAGSICLNASGSALNPNQAGFFVRPIRGVALGLGVGVVFYDSATFELQYSTT